MTAPASVHLAVPYEHQLNNRSGTGYRECFSSSCAMVAAYYGRVKGDDAYNDIRQRYGDSTDVNAQIAALRSLGLDARLVTNGTLATLEAELQAGRPVPVGWLHKGPVTSPTGGGHWTVAIGYDLRTIIHNDPNGEADMVNGGYVSNTAAAGSGVAYSRKNWGRRWEVDGPASGWMLIIKAPSAVRSSAK